MSDSGNALQLDFGACSQCGLEILGMSTCAGCSAPLDDCARSTPEAVASRPMASRATPPGGFAAPQPLSSAHPASSRSPCGAVTRIPRTLPPPPFVPISAERASPEPPDRDGLSVTGTRVAMMSPRERSRAADEAQRHLDTVLQDLDGGFESILNEQVDADRRALGALVDELRDLHTAYERASARWLPGGEDAKKQLRRARNDALGRITELLDRLGERDLRQQLERLPFERKIRNLESVASQRGR